MFKIKIFIWSILCAFVNGLPATSDGSKSSVLNLSEPITKGHPPLLLFTELSKNHPYPFWFIASVDGKMIFDWNGNDNLKEEIVWIKWSSIYLRPDILCTSFAYNLQIYYRFHYFPWHLKISWKLYGHKFLAEAKNPQRIENYWYRLSLLLLRVVLIKSWSVSKFP